MAEISREDIIKLTTKLEEYLKIQDRHEIILFGEHGDDGLVASMRSLIEWRKTIDEERTRVKGGIWSFFKPALQQLFVGTTFSAGTIIALHLAGVLH